MTFCRSLFIPFSPLTLNPKIIVIISLSLSSIFRFCALIDIKMSELNAAWKNMASEGKHRYGASKCFYRACDQIKWHIKSLVICWFAGMQGFSFGAMSARKKEINFNQVMIIKISADDGFKCQLEINDLWKIRLSCFSRARWTGVGERESEKINCVIAAG